MIERIITTADIEDAVRNVYEKYLNKEVDGNVDPRLKNVNPAKFGIVAMLTDGTTFPVGDVGTASPLGGIAKVPLITQLRIQREGSGDKKTKCIFAREKGPTEEKPDDMPVSVNGIRMMSAIEPKGDPEGKWDIISDLIIAMTGTSPVLNDDLYKSMTLTNEAADIENAMARNEFYLFDDAPISIDLYTRLTAMEMTPMELAAMGATLAAMGRNPATGEAVFDAGIAPRVIAAMAVKGPHRSSMPWLIKSGIPAKNSFGGGMLAVMPGVMAIAAYSPIVDDNGVSIKARKAIHHIMKRLNLNVFAGENIVIEH